MTPFQEELATLGVALLGLGFAVGLVYGVDRLIGRTDLARRARARNVG